MKRSNVEKKYIILRPRYKGGGIFSYMWESLQSIYPFHENINTFNFYFDWIFSPTNLRVDQSLNDITTNVWEYYFEQPSELTDDIIDYRKDYSKYDPYYSPQIRPSLVAISPDIVDQINRGNSDFWHEVFARDMEAQFWRLFHQEQHPQIAYDGISTKALKENANLQSQFRQGLNEGPAIYKNLNYTLNRFIYNKIIEHLLVPKISIQNKIDKITDKFSNHSVLGIHVRDTDHILKQPIGRILSRTEHHLSSGNFDRIFLMSDSQRVVNKFKDIYKDRLITYDEAIRSHSHVATHVDKDITNPYKVSEDVIVEAYALSKTNFLLLSGPSNVNYFSKCLSPNLNSDCVSESYADDPFRLNVIKALALATYGDDNIRHHTVEYSGNCSDPLAQYLRDISLTSVRPNHETSNWDDSFDAKTLGCPQPKNTGFKSGYENKVLDMLNKAKKNDKI